MPHVCTNSFKYHLLLFHIRYVFVYHIIIYLLFIVTGILHRLLAHIVFHMTQICFLNSLSIWISIKSSNHIYPFMYSLFHKIKINQV